MIKFIILSDNCRCVEMLKYKYVENLSQMAHIPRITCSVCDGRVGFMTEFREKMISLKIDGCSPSKQTFTRCLELR
jgi:hypothetical protein